MAMIRSLLPWLDGHKIYVICLDEGSHRFVRAANLRNVTALSITQFEKYGLTDLRDSRTPLEFFWTMSSFSLQFIFDLDLDVKILTYIDADMFFFKNPLPILETFESSGTGALITEHSYSPTFARLEKKYGKYNVQFVSVKRVVGNQIWREWVANCRNWCFARHENGQFGDQKYLDSWPNDYPGLISVWPHPEQFQGPWNMERYKPEDAVSFHFSSLKRISPWISEMASSGYRVPAIYRESIYRPYLRKLRLAELEIAASTFPDHIQKSMIRNLDGKLLVSLPKLANIAIAVPAISLLGAALTSLWRLTARLTMLVGDLPAIVKALSKVWSR